MEKPVEIAPAADTWPQWAKRKLWAHRRELVALAVAGVLAKYCGLLHEPFATVCHALNAVAHLLGL